MKEDNGGGVKYVKRGVKGDVGPGAIIHKIRAG